MSKKNIKANKVKIFIGIVLLTISIILTLLNSIYQKGIKIKEWDNYYNENNIILFYEDSTNENLKKLDERYKIKKYIENEDNEFNRVLKTVHIVKSIVEKDDVPDTGCNSAIDILEKKKDAKKVSFRDMAIITRDVINCSGVKARIGAFRRSNSQFEKNNRYYVIEYWSTEYNKWIVVDFLDQGYFKEGDTKLSAIEILNKDIRKIAYLGQSGQKDYKNMINKYLDSYTLQIENSNSKLRSNCNITYVKDKDTLELKFKDSLPGPTIFTEKTNLFEKSPFDKNKVKDDKAYLLVYISKAKENVDKNKKDEENLVISAFKEGKSLESFYVNINDSGYKEVNKSTEMQLEKGSNKVELSLDGEKCESKIIVDKN